MKLDFVAGVAPLLLEQFRRLPGIGATMTHPTHPLQPRREFLKTAALASTGLLSSSFSSEAQPGVRLCRLLPGCCAYSYGSYLAKGTMTMEDFIVKAVELGVSGVDITTYWLKSTDPAYLVSLRSFAYRHGMPFSSLAIGADLCQPDSTKRAETLQTVFKWIDATQLLGASHLRVFGDKLPPGATPEQGIGGVAETMKPACEYAAKKGIILGLESHSGLTIHAANSCSEARRENQDVVPKVLQRVTRFLATGVSWLT